MNADRCEIDGKVEDTVIAAREVNVDPTDTWVNQHINYTHGYGLVAAYGNRVAAGGRPDFMLGGIPTSGSLITDKDYEPRIYFGENSRPTRLSADRTKAGPTRNLTAQVPVARTRTPVTPSRVMVVQTLATCSTVWSTH